MGSEKMEEKVCDRQSEAYGQLEAQREQEWQEQYGIKLPHIRAEIDRILKQETEVEMRIECLSEMLESDELKRNYQMVEEIAAINIAVKVSILEIQNNEKSNILKGIMNLRELMLYLQRVRFLIYRLDFLPEEETVSEFLQMVQEKELTITSLGEFIVMAAVHPLQVALRIEEFFWNNRMYGKIVLFLEFILHKWPGNQRLMQKLVDLYLIAGKTAYAATYQKLLEEYEEGEELTLEEQERRWLLRYGDIKEEEEGTI